MRQTATVLFLTDAAQDYGADFLYDGFRTLCADGKVGEVVDWPSKRSLHAGEQRDFDCDLGWPASSMDLTEENLPRFCREREATIIIPTLRGEMPSRLVHWASWLRTIADRIVCCDFEDQAMQVLAPMFESCLGFRPAVHFKREVSSISLPLDIRVLPFGYPARRAVPAVEQREPLVIYDVHVWPWARGGLRERLGELLRERFRERADVRLHYSEATRCAPSKYHARMRCARVAVVPAGLGWFTNRLFEAVADGCAVVAEAPRVAFPDGLVDGVECLYFHSEIEGCDHVERLLNDAPFAQRLAEAGRQALLNRHTTAHRAQRVMDALT